MSTKKFNPHAMSKHSTSRMTASIYLFPLFKIFSLGKDAQISDADVKILKKTLDDFYRNEHSHYRKYLFLEKFRVILSNLNVTQIDQLVQDKNIKQIGDVLIEDIRDMKWYIDTHGKLEQSEYNEYQDGDQMDRLKLFHVGHILQLNVIFNELLSNINDKNSYFYKHVSDSDRVELTNCLDTIVFNENQYKEEYKLSKQKRQKLD